MWRGLPTAVLCALLWGSAFPVIKSVYRHWDAHGVEVGLAGIWLFAGVRFTIAGLGCLVVGAWILFPRDIPALAIPMVVLWPTVIVVALLMVAILWLVIRAQGARVVTGVEGMVGERGRAATELDPDGKVFVRGEYWNARSRGAVAAGTPVRVRAVDDMWLEVEPDEETQR